MIDLVAIGHVTFDETPSGVRPGGSAYYAALTARRLGLRVGLLTSVAPDYPLDLFPAGIEVTVTPSPQTTRYRLGEAKGARTLSLLSRAADLEAEYLPPAWREAPLAVLGPVANEVDPALAGAFDDASVAVLPQGWMRKRGRGGRRVRDHPPHRVSAERRRLGSRGRRGLRGRRVGRGRGARGRRRPRRSGGAARRISEAPGRVTVAPRATSRMLKIPQAAQKGPDARRRPAVRVERRLVPSRDEGWVDPAREA